MKLKFGGDKFGKRKINNLQTRPGATRVTKLMKLSNNFFIKGYPQCKFQLPIMSGNSLTSNRNLHMRQCFKL